MAGVNENLVGDRVFNHPEYHRVSEFLGIGKHDREDFRLAQKLSIIRDWAGVKGGSDSTEDALGTIDKMRKAIGTQAIGKTLVDQLYQRVRIDMDRSQKGDKRQGSDARVVLKEETKKAKPKTKKGSIDKVVAEAVQGVVKGSVKKAITDKKFISDAVSNAMKDI